MQLGNITLHQAHLQINTPYTVNIAIHQAPPQINNLHSQHGSHFADEAQDYD